MEIVSSYKFGSNALFVSQKLRESGINSLMIDEKTESFPFKVLVNKNDFEAAIPLIEKLEILESDLDPESEGYLSGHKEWNDKMYDPGHYTGEKIEHWMQNKDTWKYIAPIYILGGIGTIGMIMYNITVFDFNTGMWIVVSLFVGVSMIWQLKNRKKGK